MSQALEAEGPGVPGEELQRPQPAAKAGSFGDFLARLEPCLPAGWDASLQLEDPLTQTLEEVATSDLSLNAGLLALTPLPEGLHQPPDRWLLRQLGFDQARVFPLAGERPYGRLLLIADANAAELDVDQSARVRNLCAALSPELERTEARRQDEKFAARLRRTAESELAERFAESCLGLLPSVQAAAVLAVEGERLTVIRVHSASAGSLEEYLRRTAPRQGSHLEALTGEDRRRAQAVVEPEDLGAFSEGPLFVPLVEELRPGCVETVPLRASGRLAGSLILFHRRDRPRDEERAAVTFLARALAQGLDRIRPERRQGMRLLYLQELMRSSDGSLLTVLKTVVEEVVSFLGADAGLLALIDTETGSLLFSQQTGYGEGEILPETLPLTDEAEERSTETSLAVRVVRTGDPSVVADLLHVPHHTPADPTMRSEIAVPLRLGGETVGVALASSLSPGHFQAEDCGRFQLFADQVAVAVDNARLLDELRRQKERRLLQRQRESFGFHPSLQAEDVEYHFGNLVGDPQGPFGEVYRSIERLADREDDAVLITGETGTGKEMVAHAIHNASARRARPLVATNFGALGGDSNLIQSELFGHEKGSFTGAVRRRRGCFELAHRSTLLIDELGDVVAAVQVKLLRVLGSSSRREFTRLGGEEVLRSDVRILAATNKDLRREMAAGRFREDLYYRVSALVVRVPPLRSRPQDVVLFLRHFLAKLARGQVLKVRRGVLEELQGYSWPGNVRQLESVLLRALVMFGGRHEISADDVRQALALEEDLQLSSPQRPSRLGLECPDPAPPGWFWREVQEPWKAHRLAPSAVRDLLSRHLSAAGGYYTQVARRLGVAPEDYQRFLDFLKHTGLKVDYRPYRSRKARRA